MLWNIIQCAWQHMLETKTKHIKKGKKEKSNILNWVATKTKSIAGAIYSDKIIIRFPNSRETNTPTIHFNNYAQIWYSDRLICEEYIQRPHRMPETSKPLTHTHTHIYIYIYIYIYICVCVRACIRKQTWWPEFKPGRGCLYFI